MGFFKINFIVGLLVVTLPSLMAKDELWDDSISNELYGIDPIVTGQKVSEEHLNQWKKQNKLYNECPECFYSQPFPSD